MKTHNFFTPPARPEKPNSNQTSRDPRENWKYNIALVAAENESEWPKTQKAGGEAPELTQRT